MGHHLEAIVHVGIAGVTEGVCKALGQALADHELVKVKMQEIPGERKACALELAEKTQSALVQLLGKTALYFKAKPEESKKAAPKAAKAGPKAAKAGPRAAKAGPKAAKAGPRAAKAGPRAAKAAPKPLAPPKGFAKKPAAPGASGQAPKEPPTRQASTPRSSSTAELSRKAWLERGLRTPQRRGGRGSRTLKK